jgi:hypothetical protein
MPRDLQALFEEHGIRPLPLSFTMESDHIVIEYREAEYVMEEPSVLYHTTSISFVDLYRDSDRDSLTDIQESTLYTDPFRADSDDDGIEDSYDSCPLSNRSTMGVPERGVERALLNYMKHHSQVLEKFNGRSLLYVTYHNVGPVEFSPGPEAAAIWIPYGNGRGYGDFTVELTKPEDFEPMSVLDDPHYFTKEQLPAGCAYIVEIYNLGTWHSIVPLVDKDGELYPSSIVESNEIVD